MATGLEPGDPTNYPADIRFPVDGEQPNSATLFVPPVKDLADRTAYLAERVSGGKRALHGKLTTDGAGNVAITGGSGGYTAEISGQFIRVTFSTAKANAHYTVTGSVANVSGPGFRAFGWEAPTTTTVDLASFSAFAAQVNLATTAQTVCFKLEDDE